MKTTEDIDSASPLSPAIPEVHDPHVMPGEFAGMYQAGFDAGYKSGKEAGYRESFNESRAAVHQGPNGVAIKAAVAGKPAPKLGPRRMLLGMPCERCRVYLLSEETHCPWCKQAQAA